ncbi:uncharacterized protein LOC142972553 [Anticarsia gemmatalis]|uniref:uncharacterized protein LOC142972553 n=1 Tax=Anticarsia gemmatalis TaxID=129554 RepID=UPI003F763C90
MGDIAEFVTMHGYQKVFYKITSSAISFEIKTTGNAVIGLAKKIGPECDFLIAIGNDRRSWIKKLHGREFREVAETPNILTPHEFRRFWLSWDGDGIRLGGEGHNNPIVACNCKATDMKYITFFVISEHYQFPVFWRVELPPVIKKPALKPITEGELYWVPIEADTDVLPPDGALIGGYEKENLYVIRSKHRGSVTPGKFVPSLGLSFISWGGESHNKSTYEVLCGFDCMWVPTSKDRIPVGAVVGGHSENIEHEKLYVGRVRHLGHIIPGKVQPSHRVCYVAYEGKEVGVENYEILVVPEQRRCANTLLVPHMEMNLESDDDNDDDHDSSVDYNEDAHFFVEAL